MTRLFVLLLPLVLGAQEPVQFKVNIPATEATSDADGNVWFGGTSEGALPTTPGAFRTEFAACPSRPPVQQACSWAFVGKLSPSGQIQWLTWLPEPNGNSEITDITTDRFGAVYVTGRYATRNNQPPAFPTTPGAYEPTSSRPYGVFLVKLSPDGSRLVWSTFFSGADGAASPVVDGDGNMWVGLTRFDPVQWPEVNPISGMAPGPGKKAYLAKFSADGSRLLLGSNIGTERALSSGIAPIGFDASGNFYAFGFCDGLDCMFTTPGAWQRSTSKLLSMFLIKLHPSGSLIYSTWLQGSSWVSPHKVQVDAAGNVTLAGSVYSDNRARIDFPVTPGALQASATKRNRGTPTTGFVTRLDPTGSKLLYSTYLGGSHYDGVDGLALDAAGLAVVTGYSYSADFPTTADAWKPCHPAFSAESANGPSAPYVARLAVDGSALSYSSFFGPIVKDGAYRIIGIDRSGDLYVLGTGTRPETFLMRYRMTTRPPGTASCVMNAVDGYESPAAPLSMVRVRGNQITDPSRLVSLSADGAPAQVLSATANEVTAILPSGLAGGTTLLRIEQDGITTAAIEAPVTSMSIAIVSTDGSGLDGAAGINENGTLNSSANPAVPGSIVSLFLTGLGLTTPRLEAGQVAASPGGVAANFDMTIGGVKAEVLYAGPAPGLLAGVYQINLRVPVTRYTGWESVRIASQDRQPVSLSRTEIGIYATCAAQAQCILAP